MLSRLATFFAGLIGASAIGLGAFGAHSLKGVLFRHGTHEIWNTAVLYHLIHALALLWTVRGSIVKLLPYCCWLIGIFLFSGSLYLMALFGVPWLGVVTPIGGIFLIAGWLFVAVQKA